MLRKPKNSRRKKLHRYAQTNHQPRIHFVQINQDFQHVAVALFRRVACPHALAAHLDGDARDAAAEFAFGEGWSGNGNALPRVDAAQITFVHFGANAQPRSVGQTDDGLWKQSADRFARFDVDAQDGAADGRSDGAFLQPVADGVDALGCGFDLGVGPLQFFGQRWRVDQRDAIGRRAQRGFGHGQIAFGLFGGFSRDVARFKQLRHSRVLRPRLFQHGLLADLVIKRSPPLFIAAAARKPYARLLGGFNCGAGRLQLRLQGTAIEQRQSFAHRDLLPLAHTDFTLRSERDETAPPASIWALVLIACLTSAGFAQNQAPRPASATESAVEELANALVTAKTEIERAALLDAKKDLQTEALAQALIRQGNRLRQQGLFPQAAAPQALSIFQLAQGIAERLGYKTGLATALHNTGDVHRNQGNRNLALEHYRKSLALREELGDKAGIAATLLGIGFIYSAQGNFASALEHYQKSFAIYESLDDKTATAQAQHYVGNAYLLQGNYASALETYQKVLMLRETLDNQAATAAARDRVATLYLAQGELDLALEHYKKNLALYEALSDKARTAQTLLGMGEVYRMQGKMGIAADAYQKAASLYESIGDKGQQGTALIYLAFIPHAQSNYSLAFEYYRKGLTLKEAHGWKPGISMALYYLAQAQNDSGNYSLALESYQKVIALGSTVADRYYAARSLRGMGNAYARQGKYDLAKEHYQKGVAQFELFGGFKTELANVFCYIGDLYRLADNYNYALALENYQKCLSLREAMGEKWMAGAALTTIGNLHYKEKNYTEALRVGLRSIEIGQQNGSAFNIGSPATLVGMAYRSLNQLAEARAAFDKAISAAESLRAGVVGNELESRHLFSISPYHEMLKLLVAQNQPAAAFTYAERAKARALLDVLQHGRVSVDTSMNEQEQAQEESLRRELVSINSRITAEAHKPQPDQSRLAELKAKQQTARQSYEAFQSSLYFAHPKLRLKRGEAPTLKLDEAAGLFTDPNQALLEYVVTDEQSFLFVLTKSAGNQAVKVEVYPLTITAKELRERAEAFRQQLAKRSPEFGSSARELYGLLLKPAAAQLRGKTALVIVPDGPLWELPFQALQPSSNRFLIEDCAISYAPSLTVLREMAKAGKKSSGSQSALLALGNPALGQETVSRAKSVLMDEKFEPLPEAEAQVKTLGRLYGPRQSKVYTGAEAREGRAKAEAGNYRILHLATHGVLNDASPMYSHLLLAQTGEPGKEAHEDGLLEAWELMKLDLNADLVVLSACETARGRVGAGECRTRRPSWARRRRCGWRR